MTRRERLIDWLIDTRLNRWSIRVEDALEGVVFAVIRLLVGLPRDR